MKIASTAKKSVLTTENHVKMIVLTTARMIVPTIVQMIV